MCALQIRARRHSAVIRQRQRRARRWVKALAILC
jgi:hypothetical protein